MVRSYLQEGAGVLQRVWITTDGTKVPPISPPSITATEVTAVGESPGFMSVDG